MDLTDNAVRAHLLSLERDRLVEPGGTVKGFRKPHYLYRLTGEARNLFPKPYDSLFNRLIGILKARFPSTTLNEILRDTGRLLAGTDNGGSDGDVDAQIEKSIRILEEAGGAARVVIEDGQTKIKSESCPFAEAVAEHPEVCQIVESMIEEIVGKPVKEICDRSASPKCCFIIKTV